jgi:hypothetical protein
MALMIRLRQSAKSASGTSSRRPVVACAILFIFPILIPAEPTRQWMDGTVVSISRAEVTEDSPEYSRSLSTRDYAPVTTSIATSRLRWTIYRFRVKDTVYVATVGGKGIKGLKVGDAVHFALTDSTLYVHAADHRERRFRLARQGE